MNRTMITTLLLTSLGIAQLAPADVGAPKSRDFAPLSIAVDDPKGGSFRLVHAAGNGWNITDQSSPKFASTSPNLVASELIPAIQSITPQSVYVDGPSGYVFVYVIDDGWRFVGSVANSNR